MGYEPIAPPKNVVLPPARSPAESLAAIEVSDGLLVELVASEPSVMDPIDVAWGTDGRMWVVEMADYPAGLDGKGQPGGRIRILESTHGDGHYDKSTLFVDNLNFPNSVMPWRKGVLVAAAPDILYLEDTDGDGRADRIENIFTGFREGNQQHRANGLQWGLDGWLYLANGNSGGKLRSPKTGEVLELGRRDLRIKPDAGVFELVSGQTQYGRNRDDWGNWFGGNNSNPVWHYVLDERYIARNPHFVAPNSVVSLPTISGAAPVYPVSETMARFNDANRANHFTSACGTMIYRDELLGSEYAGNVFVCEPVHNLVHREIISPHGVTFTSRRAPQEQVSEFFSSADSWSRFTTARTGPDGALYIVDMYRLVIEHPTWIPESWQKLLGDLRAGSDKGRIYRVARRNVPLRPVPRIDQMPTAALVSLLENPNGTVRDLVQQELTWREDTSAVPALEKLITSSPQPQSRVQALCTLDTMGALTRSAVALALRDAHPGMLRQALRLSDRFAAADDEDLLSWIIELADHPDPMVRQQVAYSLGEWRHSAAGAALAQLLVRNGDPYVRAAGISSALPHAATLFSHLDSIGDRGTLVEVAVATRNAAALAQVLRAICVPRQTVPQHQQLSELADLLNTLQRNNQSLSSLQLAAGQIMKAALAETDVVFATARRIAVDKSAPVEERLVATAVLGRGVGSRSDDEKTLGMLLVPQSPVELQLAAISAMANIHSPTIPGQMLAAWPEYGPRIRTAVFDLLASRTEWAHAMLNRIEAERAMLPQVDLGRRAALSRHSDIKVAERATKVFNAGIDANRQQVIDRYLTNMRQLKPDRARGATVFGIACAACHRFGEISGRAIGPDLAAIKDRSEEYLVTHILDPNRAVEDRYSLYSATTNDGRSVAGMLASESGTSVTFLALDGAEQVVFRSELKAIATNGHSLMPEGLETAIDPQAMADLAAFIGGEVASDSRR